MQFSPLRFGEGPGEGLRLRCETHALKCPLQPLALHLLPSIEPCLIFGQFLRVFERFYANDRPNSIVERHLVNHAKARDLHGFETIPMEDRCSLGAYLTNR